MALDTDQVDQDALAAEWGLALEADAANAEQAAAPAEGAAPGSTEAAASQWAAMVDDGSSFMQTAKGGAERVLSQDEIDSLLGFSLADVSLNDNSGIRAIIDSAMVSYERLPMLEIVFDRLVRLMTTSLRNFTSDNVESRSTALPRCASATILTRSRCRRFSACSRRRSGTISASSPSIRA